MHTPVLPRIEKHHFGCRGCADGGIQRTPASRPDTRGDAPLNLQRILPVLGDRETGSIEPSDVAALVSQLREGGLERDAADNGTRHALEDVTRALDEDLVDR